MVDDFSQDCSLVQPTARYCKKDSVTSKQFGNTEIEEKMQMIMRYSQQKIGQNKKQPTQHVIGPTYRSVCTLVVVV
jgi:hypothetical protein